MLMYLWFGNPKTSIHVLGSKFVLALCIQIPIYHVHQVDVHSTILIQLAILIFVDMQKRKQNKNKNKK